MTVTLNDMLERVAELVKDVHHEKYTQRLLRDRIKTKLQVYGVSLGLFKKDTFIPFRSGIDVYKLPVDFYGLRSMKLRNHRGKLIMHSNYDTESYAGNLNYGRETRAFKGDPKVFFYR